MIEPNNLEWLDEIFYMLNKRVKYEVSQDLLIDLEQRQKVAKLAITSKINEIENQARIDELERMFPNISRSLGNYNSYIYRLAELRKRKDEVL